MVGDHAGEWQEDCAIWQAWAKVLDFLNKPRKILAIPDLGRRTQNPCVQIINSTRFALGRIPEASRSLESVPCPLHQPESSILSLASRPLMAPPGALVAYSAAAGSAGWILPAGTSFAPDQPGIIWLAFLSTRTGDFRLSPMLAGRMRHRDSNGHEGWDYRRAG